MSLGRVVRSIRGAVCGCCSRARFSKLRWRFGAGWPVFAAGAAISRWGRSGGERTRERFEGGLVTRGRKGFLREVGIQVFGRFARIGRVSANIFVNIYICFFMYFIVFY